MENLPPEILENVFHPLSKKEDIENCSNVNSKWRNVIEKMFASIPTTILKNFFKDLKFRLSMSISTDKLIEPSDLLKKKSVYNHT